MRDYANPAATWCKSACTRTFACCIGAFMLAAAGAIADADAQTLPGKAKESGCVDTPRIVGGSMYRCNTASGAAAYFNVPGADNAPPVRKEATTTTTTTKSTPTPAGFPKVDADTQKGRDDTRRKVLSEELAAEEKMLAAARAAYANGAPVPLPEEQANAEKYRERIARLRQSVGLHERNIEALKKELGPAR
jgi:hypothetical protein